MTIFAYIAHKDGEWVGVCSAKGDRSNIAKFLSFYVRQGFDIMSVATREEYLAKLDSMKMWGDEEARLPFDDEVAK